MKKISLLLASVLCLLALTACEEAEKKPSNSVETSTEATSTKSGDKTTSTTSKPKEENKTENKESENKKMKDGKDPNRYSNVEQNPIVTMEMEDGGVVKMELYPQIAPASVENFVSLINQGFYDGVIFHRVMPSFMAQGGDPLGTGFGGPGYSIVGEFAENGFTQNNLKHDIGVLSMARATDPDTAGSQFFIVTNENSYQSLDNKYAGFGKVIEGMDEVYKIVNSPVKYSTEKFQEVYYKIMSGQTELTPEEAELVQAYQAGETFDRPLDPPTIKKMTVETFGVEYEEPTKLDRE